MERHRRLGLVQMVIILCVALALSATAWRGPGSSASSSPTAHHTASHLAPADAALARVSVKDTRKVILVVGDSLVAQSTAALKAQSDSKVEVLVAGRLGSAPCDWTGGDFKDALDAAQPDVVIFAFAGNAGSAASCVGNGAPRAYALNELLDNYRLALNELAGVAQASGASVVLSAPPARNPGVPAPPAVPTAKERKSLDAYYGFQGVPQVRDLYADMVGGSNGQWRFTDAAALAVSPNFEFTRTLACNSEDGHCPKGVVDVREGGHDAIHLDAAGHGAQRFAQAMISSVQNAGGASVLTGA